MTSFCEIHKDERWRQERSSRHGSKGADWMFIGCDSYPYRFYYCRPDRYSILCSLWHCHAMVAVREFSVDAPLTFDNGDYTMAKNALNSALEKIKRNGAAGEKAFDEEFAAAYPTVHALMCDTEIAKGKPRQTCSAVIWTDHGLFNVVLTERDMKMKIFAGGPTVSDMWASLEERVSSPSPDWTEDTKKKR